jgi:hypothetical protein
MATLTWEQIDDFGAACGAKPFSRIQWRYRGIPHKYRLPILQEAQRRGMIVGADALPAGKHEKAPKDRRAA